MEIEVRRCVEILIWLSLFSFMFLFSNSFASAAEREDYRHKLCAEGKLPWLDIGNSIGMSVNSSDEVYRTDRPFYAEVKRGGRIIGGCIPAGTPISAKKGNRFAEHFALKGWRDILNFIPLPIEGTSTIVERQVFVERPERPEEPRNIKEVVEKREQTINIFLTEEQVGKIVRKEKKPKYLPADDEVFGLKKDTWRKVFYCVGGATTGYGIKSKNAGLIGGGAVVVGVTLYFDKKDSFADQLTLADVGITALCGVAAYLATPAKKPSTAPSPSNPSSGTSTPGPNPPLGSSTPGTGTGPGPSSPPL